MGPSLALRANAATGHRPALAGARPARTEHECGSGYSRLNPTRSCERSQSGFVCDCPQRLSHARVAEPNRTRVVQHLDIAEQEDAAVARDQVTVMPGVENACTRSPSVTPRAGSPAASGLAAALPVSRASCIACSLGSWS